MASHALVFSVATIRPGESGRTTALRFDYDLAGGERMSRRIAEGFWDREEAEGGARLLLGPSIQLAPPGRRWQIAAAGGPTFHPRDTGRASGAVRDLPPGSQRYGYAVKAGLTYRMF